MKKTATYQVNIIIFILINWSIGCNINLKMLKEHCDKNITNFRMQFGKISTENFKQRNKY